MARALQLPTAMAGTRKVTRLHESFSNETVPSRSLVEEMGVTERELAHRKEVLRFTAQDEENLKKLAPFARRYAADVTEAFYRHLLSFEDMRAFFTSQETLDYVKKKQTDYFIRLTEGNYGMEYIENRLLIGAVHERIGLPIKTYLSMYSFYQMEVAARLRDIYHGQLDTAVEVFQSLLKLIQLDIICAIETYTFRREQTIRRQEEAIRELSTPVLRIRDRLLILPIIGLIDTQRAMQITGQLLNAIRDARARVVVIDITGVPVVDTDTANHLVQTVEAARLLGAHVITTGLSPEIAQTIVRLGVDLSRLNTVGDLQGGIEEAEALLGIHSVSMKQEPQGAA